MSDTENILTFGELRKKQKEEDREDELLDLDDKFLMRVSTYLDQKEDAEGKSREYRNAERVLDKIISLREEKIVRKARLAVKTDIKASKLDLLPEEQEMFRDIKNVFENRRERVEKAIEKQGRVEIKDSSKKEDKGKKEEKETEPDTEKIEEKELNETEDGYKLVKIQSEVPEFMGTDLEAYGPFDKGEKVKIPEDNAEILINRGNAELIGE